jgi:predicted CXXCH cytochrome family protein
MEEASEETVLGDFDGAELEHFGVTSRFYRRDGRFFVWTEGAAGEMAEHEVAYTFGFAPLQQYLVRFPGGRLQALSLAWDVAGERWFHLYPDRRISPDDWLHWTRNGQNWNGMCAECHSTNLEKRYDPTTRTYATSWSDLDVGCEACHGPGSAHLAWKAAVERGGSADVDGFGLVVRTSELAPGRLVELCAPCHSRRVELGDYDHSGAELLDHMLPALLGEGLYHADGQIRDEVYVYGSFLQSRMYAQGVGCSDCHDSHRLGLVREGDELCLQCHDRSVYGSAEHHFHPQVAGGRDAGAIRCVDCHMVEQTFMVVDRRADHSFQVPRPDLAEELQAPLACTQSGCHDHRPLAWTARAYRRWYGAEQKPHFGRALAAGRAGDLGAVADLVRLAGDRERPVIVRATAIALLGGYPEEDARAAVEIALGADESLLRATAAAAVDSSEPAHLAALAPLLFDPVKAVRLAVVPRLAGTPARHLDAAEQQALELGLAEYREALRHTLDFAASSLSLGNLEANLGRPDEAERFYRRALEIDDRFSPARGNLAVLLSGQGRSSEAARLLEEVLAADPDDFEAAYSLGLLRAEMGQARDALPLLERAVAAAPRHARARYNLGLLLGRLERPEESEGALAAALELEPSDLDFLYALAEHYIRHGQPERARPLAERMIRIHPEAALGYRLERLLDEGRQVGSAR